MVLALFAALTAAAQKPMPTRGLAILDAGNKHDIHDRRNQKVRARLMQEAVIDAIERVVSIDISVATMLRSEEKRTSEGGAFTESYVNEMLQRYRVKWKREGEYSFARVPGERSLWKCEVAGIVEEGGALPAEPKMEGGERSFAVADKDPFIAGKRGGMVQIAPRKGQLLHQGQRFEVVRMKELGNGSQFARPVGRVVVTDNSEAAAPLARVIKGRQRVKEGMSLRPAEFPLIRGGLRLGVMGQENYVRATAERGPITEYVTGASIEYFEQSLLDKFGVIIGLDMLTHTVSDSIAYQAWQLRAGGMLPIGLVPELLFLVPSLTAGIGSGGNQYGGTGMPFVIAGQLDLMLRLDMFDLAAGMRYSQMIGHESFSGPFAVLSVGFDLYRFYPQANGRSTPGLREMVRTLGGG
jgi:hypothetical protein